MKEKIEKLEKEILILKTRRELPHPVVDVDLEDPSPKDEESRRNYVGQVAGFHTEIQKKKILSLISQIRGEFEKIDRSTFGYSQSDYDLFLKGTINGLWLIHDWGEEMINEYLSYQIEEPEFSEEDKQVLKSKLN